MCASAAASRRAGPAPSGLVIDPRFRTQVIPGEGVLVVSETSATLLRGEVYEQLIPRLDGRHGLSWLVDALSTTIDPVHVRYAVARLTKVGVVMEAVPDVPPPRIAFWRELGLDAALTERRLSEAEVDVLDLSDEAADGVRDQQSAASVDQLCAALSRCGVATRSHTVGSLDLDLDLDTSGDHPAALSVVLVRDYLQPELVAINASALRSGRSWLLVKPVGRQVWVGPLFRRGDTGCWECLAQRLRGNRDVARYLAERAGWPAPVSIAAMHLPATRAIAADLAALTVLRALTAEHSADNSADHDASVGLSSIDTITGAREQHTLVRRHDCPACGDQTPATATAPVILPSSPVLDATDGGFRATSAEEVLTRYQHHVSPITGAVPALTRVPLAGADLLRVYVAGQNLAMPARTLDRLRHSLRSVSAGKGISDAQARASALCEALERFSGQRRGTEFAIRSSFRDLGSEAIHPNACMLYSDEQYANAGTWNARGSVYARVPEPFDEEVEVEWTPVWSLTSNSARLLPTAYCYYGPIDAPDAAYYLADSNGCAAGSTLTEAVLQGFLELVERDSVAIWWYHRLTRPGVDLNSFDEPYLQRLPGQYERLNRELWVLDLTHDLGIPVFVAISRRPGQDPEQVHDGLRRPSRRTHRRAACRHRAQPDGVPGSGAGSRRRLRRRRGGLGTQRCRKPTAVPASRSGGEAAAAR